MKKFTQWLTEMADDPGLGIPPGIKLPTSIQQPANVNNLVLDQQSALNVIKTIRSVRDQLHGSFQLATHGREQVNPTQLVTWVEQLNTTLRIFSKVSPNIYNQAKVQ